MKRWCAAVLTAVVLVTTGVSSAAAQTPAAPTAAPTSDPSVVGGKTYVQARFDDAVYRVTVDSSGAWVGRREHVTYAQWKKAGFPTPRVVEPRLVKFPWSSEIYPVMFWPDHNRNQGELIGETGEPITYRQWASIGTPAPRGVEGFCNWASGCEIQQYATSSELFLRVFSSSFHKLTFAEWKMIGAPSVGARNAGVYKLSWSDRIFFANPEEIGPRVPNYSNMFDTGTSLSYASWRQLGFPTPRVVESTKWDRFFVLGTDFGYGPQVYFDGMAGCFTVDAAMWARAGRPQPLKLYGGFPSSRDWCV